jgi:hypothetical protein
LHAPGPQPEEGIGSLFSRLIDDGRDLFRAETALYREITLNRLVRSRSAIILAAIGLLLAQASVTALLVGLLFGLAWYLGPIGAGVVIAIVGLAMAGLLFRAAVKRFAAATDLASNDDKGI